MSKTKIIEDIRESEEGRLIRSNNLKADLHKPRYSRDKQMQEDERRKERSIGNELPFDLVNGGQYTLEEQRDHDENEIQKMKSVNGTTECTPTQNEKTKKNLNQTTGNHVPFDFKCKLEEQSYQVEDEMKKKKDVNGTTECTSTPNEKTTNNLQQVEEIQEKEEKQIEGHVPNWEQALDENDTALMQTLLNDDRLPSQQDVQRAYGLYKEKALTRGIIDAITLKICDYIKTKSTNINTVSVCYKADDQEQVVFVAMADTEIRMDFEYEVKVCHPQGYSKEGSFITSHDERRKKKFTPEESEDILATIQEHSSELFEKHSNLRIIDGCSVKSQGYQTNSFRIDNKQTCIVLYVNAKGLIPLHEERFSEHLLIPGTNRSISVDVREGGVRFFGKPNEFHQNLKMGCEITDGGPTGTVGAFFEKKGKSYCLTSAHVFFGNKRFKEAMLNDRIYKREDDSTDDILVYQNVRDSHTKIGVVTEAILEEGNDKTAGIDVAFIELTEAHRLPIDGAFPDGDYQSAGFSFDQTMVYKTGKVYDQTSFRRQTSRNKEVVKYGSKTEVTTGTFDLEGPCVSFDPEGYRLNNQLTFLSVCNQYGKPFASPGDSGALVFAKHEGRWSDLRVVGIIEGGMEDEKIVVTPIWDIFERFGMSIDDGLKKFDLPSLEPNAECNVLMDTSPPVEHSNFETSQDRNDMIQKQLIDKVTHLQERMDEMAIEQKDQKESIVELKKQNAAGFEMIMNKLQSSIDKNTL